MTFIPATSAKELFPRSSGVGHIMSDPKGKSNMDKYLELKDELLIVGSKIDGYDPDKRYQVTYTKLIIKKNDLIERVEAAEKIKNIVTLSETAKGYWIDLYLSDVENRKDIFDNKYTKKGNEQEKESTNLLSVVTGRFYAENTIRLKNRWVQGCWDLHDVEEVKLVILKTGEEITNIKHTLDTKTSWSARTFLMAKLKELETLYYWQGVCYMWLTGALKHTVAYCLVNGLDSQILAEKLRIRYKYDVLDLNDHSNLDYLSECQQIERNHIFDINKFVKENPYYQFHSDVTILPSGKASWDFDRPLESRLHTITFDRDENDIEAVKKRVDQGREWAQINLFDKKLYLAA